MIDRELLGKVTDKTDKDDDFFTDVPRDWVEGKTDDKKKKLNKKAVEKGCMTIILTTIVIVLGLFFLLAVLVETQDVDINSNSPSSHNETQSKWEMDRQQRIERRTSAGVPIERDADIDYRIDSDKIINLSVSMIRRKGYSCNSLSNIKLYKYPERIVVECNEGKDKYRVQKDSAGRMRQVTRI